MVLAVTVKPQLNVAKVFDPVKLDSMVEPLAVRVEKIRGGVRTMIPLLDADDGSPQGTNLSKQDIRGLEQWLVNEWSGGGAYLFTLTDSTAPTPMKMEWTNFYPPSEYPEKTPPTLAAAAAEPRSIHNQQVPRMAHPSAFPNGFPGGFTVPQQGFYAQPQATPIPRGVDPAIFAAQAQADADRRRLEETIRELQAQNQRAREESIQAQYRNELTRQEQAQNDRFAKLETLLAQLMQTQARPAVDPQNEALKMQLEKIERERENDHREREAERREREIKDLIARQAEDSRRQFELFQQQIAQNKAPDPMLAFLQEHARQQSELMKEQSRNSTLQMEKLQGFVMHPRDVMTMTKESSSGLDTLAHKMSAMYGSVIDLQQKAFENFANLTNQGGSETVGLIKEGLDRASSFAEKFIGGKSKEQIVAQQTQAEMAKAQAQAMAAQASVMATQHAMRQQGSAGLNGPPNVVTQPAQVANPQVQPQSAQGLPRTAGPAGETRVSQTSSVKADAWTTGPVPPISAHAKPEIVRKGRTDVQWFGPIMGEVTALRGGVARFIESISMSPPRMDSKDPRQVDGIEPEQCADAILRAATLIQAQQIPVSAMVDLFNQGLLADFMDVLLPDAPQTYRDTVAQIVIKVLQDGGGDEDEDDDDDDDEDSDEATNGTAVVSQQAGSPVAAPTPQARA